MFEVQILVWTEWVHREAHDEQETAEVRAMELHDSTGLTFRVVDTETGEETIMFES